MPVDCRSACLAVQGPGALNWLTLVFKVVADKVIRPGRDWPEVVNNAREKGYEDLLGVALGGLHASKFFEISDVAGSIVSLEHFETAAEPPMTADESRLFRRGFQHALNIFTLTTEGEPQHV